MSDTLSHEDLKILQRPFALDEHEFNKRGFCYVKEYFVTKRLEEVDPAWQFEVVDVHRTGVGDQLAVVTARMTVNGVTRSSTGMQAVEYTNQKDAKGNITGKTETEAGEAEKGATTDALRRCARLFGVGRYILLMGDSVKNEKQLADWLKKHYSAPQAGNLNGTAQAQGELKITGVKAVKVVHKGDKKWLDAGGVTFWSRQAFTDAGYDTETWTKPGVIQLKEVPFTVVYTVKDNFKNGVKVIPE
jgi:hypothetical protein